MEAPQVVVLWTCQDPEVHAWKWSELKKGNLRQGWGLPGTSLVEDGNIVPLDTWAERYVSAAKRIWGLGDYDAVSRYQILKRMVPLEGGDLVVIPRMPGDHQFTIARVHMGYWFENPTSGAFKHDFGHIISIDASDLKTFECRLNSNTRLISGKFGRYRSGVNNVREPIYATAVFELAGDSIR